MVAKRHYPRTTPALMGLYSLVTLWAEAPATGRDALCGNLVPKKRLHLHRCNRRRPTPDLGVGDITDTSASDRDRRKIPPDRLIRMAEAPCFAA